jgi:hypothetical protein
VLSRNLGQPTSNAIAGGDDQGDPSSRSSEIERLGPISVKAEKGSRAVALFECRFISIRIDVQTIGTRADKPWEGRLILGLSIGGRPPRWLYRKGPGVEARLCYIGPGLMMGNRSGRLVDVRLTGVSGDAERLAALEMIEPWGASAGDHLRRRQGLRRPRLRGGVARVERAPAAPRTFRVEAHHPIPHCGGASPTAPSPSRSASAARPAGAGTSCSRPWSWLRPSAATARWASGSRRYGSPPAAGWYEHDRHRAVQPGGGRRLPPGAGARDGSGWSRARTSSSGSFRGIVGPSGGASGTAPAVRAWSGSASAAGIAYSAWAAALPDRFPRRDGSARPSDPGAQSRLRAPPARRARAVGARRWRPGTQHRLKTRKTPRRPPLGVGTSYGAAALRLLDNGYAPLPIAPGTKRSTMKAWSTVTVDETSVAGYSRRP